MNVYVIVHGGDVTASVHNLYRINVRIYVHSLVII